MPNITQIQVGTTTYDIIDSTASTEINEIKEISLKAQYNENTETIEFSQGISSITSSGDENIDIIWGNISGTLSNQTDLNTALNGKAATSHTHDYNTDLTNKPTLGTMAAKDDAPSDESEYVRKNGSWSVASSVRCRLNSVDVSGIVVPAHNFVDISFGITVKSNKIGYSAVYAGSPLLVISNIFTDNNNILKASLLNTTASAVTIASDRRCYVYEFYYE